MSGSRGVEVSKAGPFKWDGAEWNFWSFAPTFAHRLEPIKGASRSFVWLYNGERKRFIHAVVSPLSPYVNTVRQSVAL